MISASSTSTRRLRATPALFAILALLAVLAGCAPGGGGFAPPPMPVETAGVTQSDVTDRFDVVGTINASEAITVVSEIDGAVVSLPFREGDPIAKGGLIAQIDDAQLRAEVERTEALRDQSRSRFDRVKSVVDQGAGAPQDLDDAAAALKVAEANLALAQARLAKTRIIAPFEGVLGARRVSPGAFVRAGDPLTELARLAELRVNFSAPERYLARLKRGAKVAVSTTAYPGYALKGRIDVVDPVLDEATRSARVVALVRNPGGRFRPGMSANVSAVLSRRANAITIPSEAVFAEGDQSFVYVVKPDSTVSRNALTLGTRFADAVEVTKGLTPGTRIVRAGHQKLFDGAKVIPIVSRATGGAAPDAPAGQAGNPGEGAGK